jgi:hypothetical protein
MKKTTGAVRKLPDKVFPTPIPGKITKHPHLKEYCPVCRHKQKKNIEKRYVQWEPTKDLALDYGIPYWWIRYHMDVTGKETERRANIKSSLSRIIEVGVQKDISAGEIVSAVTAMSKINDAGKWVDKHEVESDGILEISIVNYNGK